MAFAATEHGLVVEGGGAVGIAALLAGKISTVGENVAVVVSGGNIEARVLARIISERGGG
jgi:threonine dehydratase